MTQHPKALWAESLQLIRSNVTEEQFKTWFAPIILESYDPATKKLLVQVASPFIYEYLEQHYVGLMKKVFTRVFGQGIKLSYKVVTDKAHNLTQILQTEQPASDQMPAATQPAPVNAIRSNGDMVQPLDSQLNPKLSFENFIEGDSNRLSRAVGLSIAEHPDTSQFNPMFIYGPSGCGKTHLLNAIGLKTKELYPQKRVLYVSARLFQVQFTDATRHNTTNDFIRFYQTIDLLIVDDVQEWITAPKTQDTFFHIFNHLFLNGKRIILASDRPPVDLKTMHERLITRFSCGLITELERPDTNLCLRILHNMIEREGLVIPNNVVEYIAQTAYGSVRDLQGVINSLLAYSVVYNSKIDMKLAERVISRSVKVNAAPVTIDDILDKVCAYYQVTPAAVNSKSRKRDFVQARQVSMYLAQKYTKMPASRIGKFIGGRDHSTVLHSCSQVENRLQVDKDFQAQLASIENKIKL
ncbi:MAG: chromosomal replication initiator protein DnaA [Prevotellaceae bacterium]|nr:chromosomal replication initiator protein DnaA [Prevotellaceae bacterium]